MIVKRIFNKGPKKMRTIKELKSAESKIGAKIFGQNSNIRTEFFNDNLNSWFFYQEIKKGRKRQSVTFHYEVRPNGILKIKDNDIKGCLVEGEELENFTLATKMYYEQVMRQIYQKEPYSGNF